MRALLLAVFVAIGCTPVRNDVYLREMAAAARAHHAGRLQEAAAAYDAASRAPVPPGHQVHAAYLAASLTERAGNESEARERYSALAKREDAKGIRIEAAYRLIDLELKKSDSDDAWRELEAFIIAYPESALARRGLQRVTLKHERSGGPAGALKYLQSISSLESTALGESIAYGAAQQRMSLGEVEKARDEFIAVADRWPYPKGALFDDSLYRASEIDEHLGRAKLAISDLERLLDERETSAYVGSYQRPRFTPALVRVGLLYRDAIRDHEKARRAFHRLYSDFKTSLLRDDALYEEARLWRLDNNESRACDTGKKLAREFSDSRFVACLPWLCGEAVKSAKCDGRWPRGTLSIDGVP